MMECTWRVAQQVSSKQSSAGRHAAASKGGASNTGLYWVACAMRDCGGRRSTLTWGHAR